ncbi:hypothetical protein [Streptomyces prasinus]
MHTAERLAEAQEGIAREGRALVTAVREYLSGCPACRESWTPYRTGRAP